MYQKRLKVVTSSATISGILHSFCFSDELQNYVQQSWAKPKILHCFYQKFVADLQHYWRYNTECTHAHQSMHFDPFELK